MGLGIYWIQYECFFSLLSLSLARSLSLIQNYLSTPYWTCISWIVIKYAIFLDLSLSPFRFHHMRHRDVPKSCSCYSLSDFRFDFEISSGFFFAPHETLWIYINTILASLYAYMCVNFDDNFSFFFFLSTKRKKRTHSIIYVILFNFMHFYWICFFRSFVLRISFAFGVHKFFFFVVI